MSLEVGSKIVEIAFHVITVIGGFFALYKWWTGQKTTRARYLKVLLSEFNNVQIQDFCISMEIEKDSNSYFDGSDAKKARGVRRTLRFFSYLCHALDAKLITEVEFDMFKSDMCGILSDSRVQSIVSSVSSVKGVSPYAPLLTFIEEKSLEEAR